jgi:hypothetical protein
MKTTNEKSISSLIHLSTLSQYVFPFGNYIFPLLLWTSKKDDSSYIDHNGKQALNFQLSMLVYTLTFLLISLPTFIIWLLSTISELKLNNNELTIEAFSTQNISGFVILGFVALLLALVTKIGEFFLIIYASVKSSNGEVFKYPLTINFIK